MHLKWDAVVCLLDVVEFSILSDAEQIQAIELFGNEVSDALKACGEMRIGEEYWPICTGDGWAIVMRGDNCLAHAVKLAMRLCRRAEALRGEDGLRSQNGAQGGLRIALSHGELWPVQDCVCNSLNLYGGPLNKATRIVALADPGQILCEDELVTGLPKDIRASEGRWGEIEVEVKHGLRLKLRSLSSSSDGATIGSLRPPESVRKLALAVHQLVVCYRIPSQVVADLLRFSRWWIDTLCAMAVWPSETIGDQT